MTTAILLVAILPALLVAAALFDLTSYTIPNFVPGAMIILFLAFLLAIAVSGHAMSWSDTGLHVLAGSVALVIGMAMFAVNWIGGGDAKLFAAAMLWLGWDALLQYALLTALLGGGLTLGLLLLRRVPLPAALLKLSWFARLADHRAGVPYGLALATAALAILPHTEIFRLAAVS